MTAEEPTAVGTIVMSPDGQHIAVLLEPWTKWPWRVQEVSGRRLACWEPWVKVKDWTLVHEGWTPPTPEPQHHGARVIDTDGHRGVRVWDGSVHPYPWCTSDGRRLGWDELTQPVTVVNDGSDW